LVFIFFPSESEDIDTLPPFWVDGEAMRTYQVTIRSWSPAPFPFIPEAGRATFTKAAPDGQDVSKMRAGPYETIAKPEKPLYKHFEYRMKTPSPRVRFGMSRPDGKEVRSPNVTHHF